MDQATSKKLALLLPLIIFLALIPLFFYALYEETEAIPSPLIGKPVPDFLLPDLSGEQLLDKSHLLGQPFILNVWASWCPSCIAEHPFLSYLNQSGVKVVGLNYKDERNAAETFLRDLGNPYSLIVYDEKGELALELGVYGAPENYLIDAQGYIIHKRVGVLDEAIWQAQFAEHWQRLSGSAKQ